MIAMIIGFKIVFKSTLTNLGHYYCYNRYASSCYFKKNL